MWDGVTRAKVEWWRPEQNGTSAQGRRRAVRRTPDAGQRSTGRGLTPRMTARHPDRRDGAGRRPQRTARAPSAPAREIGCGAPRPPPRRQRAPLAARRPPRTKVHAAAAPAAQLSIVLSSSRRGRLRRAARLRLSVQFAWWRPHVLPRADEFAVFDGIQRISVSRLRFGAPSRDHTTKAPRRRAYARRRDDAGGEGPPRTLPASQPRPPHRSPPLHAAAQCVNLFFATPNAATTPSSWLIGSCVGNLGRGFMVVLSDYVYIYICIYIISIISPLYLITFFYFI